MFRKQMNFSPAFWLVLLCLLYGSAAQAQQAMIKPEAVPIYRPKFFPFEGGEKAVYRTTWNGLVSVATAEIYTTPATVDGKRVYQVRVEAKTSKVLDFIWKMRDTITSTFDAESLSPAHFTFSQRENSKVIDTDARYHGPSKSWQVDRRQVGKKPQNYQFDSQNTLDPITAVYLARSIDFKVGDRLYFKVFGGRYQYLLELLVERKEPVELPSGRVEAFKIVPSIQNITKKGYAGRLNDAAVWISADERRVPVKLSSKIAFGSVHMELIQDKHGTQATAAQPIRPSS